jgi:ferric-dicitrate binding protein FerR (iron transport regulator)
MMPRMSARILPTIAAALLCLTLGVAQAATLAGSVVGLGGQVFVDRSGQRYSLRLGDQVYVEDTFEVSAGAKLKLRMGDGSVLSLAPDTTLRIDAYALDSYGRRQSAGLSLGQGLVRSVTAPGGQPANFEINTAVGTSGARSTDWFVEAAPGYEQVAVLSGGVSLTSRTTGRGVLVPPGYGSRLDAGRDPTPPRPVSQAEFAALIARTEGGAAPAPSYPPPAAPYSPYPPGYYPPGRIIQVPLPLPPGEGGRPGRYPGRGGQRGDDRDTYPAR